MIKVLLLGGAALFGAGVAIGCKYHRQIERTTEAVYWDVDEFVYCRIVHGFRKWKVAIRRDVKNAKATILRLIDEAERDLGRSPSHHGNRDLHPVGDFLERFESHYGRSRG